MKHDDTIKKQFVHDCSMPPPEDIVLNYIDGGYFVSTRRQIRRFLIVSDTNPQSKNFLRSSAAIRYEKARHLQNHYYMIHPFSDGRAYWEFYICFVLVFVLILIPIEISSRAELWFIKIPKFFLDINCLMDIGVNFSSGFYNKHTRKIILDPKYVARNYIFGFFIVDLLSSTPADMVTHILSITVKHNWAMQLFTYLKILRLFTVLKYLDRFRDVNQYSIYKFKLFKLVVVFFIGLLWATVFVFLLASNTKAVWLTEYDLFGGLLRCCFEVTYCVMLIGYTSGTQASHVPADMMVGMALLTLGVILQVFLLAQILQMVKKYNSSKNKFQHLIQQLDEYARYKDLPESMRKRIFSYFDYRFQKNYYKESDILETMSGQLRQDIILHSCRSAVESVPFFKELPTSLLVRIVTSMKSEIYLPNDVICREGMDGNSMFFIVSGTVAVYTENGKEICHLADGSYFGEISLVLENQKRVASVVAIESCEVYNLSRKDYHKAIEPYPDLRYRIGKLARDRLRKTMKAMAEEPPEPPHAVSEY